MGWSDGTELVSFCILPLHGDLQINVPTTGPTQRQLLSLFCSLGFEEEDEGCQKYNTGVCFFLILFYLAVISNPPCFKKITKSSKISALRKPTEY